MRTSDAWFEAREKACACSVRCVADSSNLNAPLSISVINLLVENILGSEGGWTFEHRSAYSHARTESGPRFSCSIIMCGRFALRWNVSGTVGVLFMLRKMIENRNPSRCGS